MLDAGIPEAEAANDKPIAGDNREAGIRTESHDGPEDASVDRRYGTAQTGFPTGCPWATGRTTRISAATKAAAGLFDQLRNEYAHVIVAAPPVLTTMTASVVSEYVDGALLIISLGETRRRDLGRAANDLRATGALLTGAVLSETKPAPDIVCGDTDRSKAHALTLDR